MNVSTLASTVHWCSLRKFCPQRSAEKSAGLCRQTDDHRRRRRVAKAAGFVMHEEMMHQGTVQSPAGDCCSGSLHSMLARSAEKTGVTGLLLLPPPPPLPGDAGVGRGRRPFPMVRRWDGCHRAICSPLQPAVSSSTDLLPAFPPISKENTVRSVQEGMCMAHKSTLKSQLTSRSSAVCLLLSRRKEKRSEHLILSLFCHLRDNRLT